MGAFCKCVFRYVVRVFYIVEVSLLVNVVKRVSRQLVEVSVFAYCVCSWYVL